MPNSSSNRSHASEHYADQLSLVHRIIETYVEISNLPPLSTGRIDHDQPSARVLVPGSVASHFKIDSERITTKALKDSPDLQAAWFKIAIGEPVTAAQEKRLVRRLGSVYKDINPTVYFRPRRLGSVHPLRRTA